MPDIPQVPEDPGLGPCPRGGLSACLRVQGIASGPGGIVFDYAGSFAFVDRTGVKDHPVEGAPVECAHCRLIRPDLVLRGDRIEKREGVSDDSRRE